MTTANRFSALFKTPTKVALTDDKSSYTNSFPSLGEAKKVPAKLDSDLELERKLKIEPKIDIDIDVNARSSAKKTVTKIILGHRSYEEELRKTDAYELFADKEKLASSLTKTRMCNSVDKNEQCVHGDNCRFAHNLVELKISTCVFEDKCRFVRMWNGKLYNNGAKICNHKHPQENTEDFMCRVGLDRYNKQNKNKEILLRPAQIVQSPPTQSQPVQFPQIVQSPPTQSQPVQFPQFVPPPPTQQQPVQFAQFVPPPPPQQQPVQFAQFVPPPPPQPQPVQFAQFVPPPPPQPQPVQFVPPPSAQPQIDSASTQPSEQILIIRVPKELAPQALEIAMKSGRIHIQVEII